MEVLPLVRIMKFYLNLLGINMDRKYMELFSCLGKNDLMTVYSDVCDSLGILYNSPQAYKVGIAMIKSYTKALNYCTSKI